jgi:hypothetical protein
MNRAFLARSFFALCLTLVSYVALASPLVIHPGGAPPSSGPANQLSTLLTATCTNCWADASTQVSTNSTMASVAYSCDTPTSCPPGGNGPQLSGSYGCGSPSICGTASFSGSSGPETAVIWGSCALSVRDDAVYCKGSGHTNYAGNEVYKFSFATLQWSLIDVPDLGGVGSGTNSGYSCGNYSASTHPLPQHEYGIYLYDSIRHLLLEPNEGCANNNLYEMDPTAQSASAFGVYVSGGAPSAGMQNEFGVFDPGLNKAFWNYDQQGSGHNNYGLFVYDPTQSVGSRWSILGTSEASREQNRTASLDPVHHLMLQFGGGVSDIGGVTAIGDIYDLTTGAVNPGCGQSTGESTYCISTTSGVTTCNNAVSSGVDWDLVISKHGLWCGGASLYTLDASSCSSSPCTPVVAALTINAANTVTPACSTISSNCWTGSGTSTSGLYMVDGINKMFFYHPTYHAFVLVANGFHSPTYFFKCDGVQC